MHRKRDVFVRERPIECGPNGLCQLTLTGRYVSPRVHVRCAICNGMRVAHVPYAKDP